MVEATFHYLETELQGWLGIRLFDHAVCHLRPDEMVRRDEQNNPLYVPVLAVILSAQPDYVFLISGGESEEEEPSALWAKGLPYKGAVLPFRCIKIDGQGRQIGLGNVLYKDLYCTSQPWSGGSGVNELAADCGHLLNWEHFTLHEIKPTEDFQRISADLSSWFVEFPSSSYIMGMIECYEGLHLSYVLDALLPFTAWSVLREVGEELLGNPLKCAEYYQKMGNGLWRDSWELLSRWVQDRDAQPSRERGCPLKDARLSYGPQDAPLGFSHAVLHAARSRVKPRKRVCLMSTIRNEGIYILEWIAYHRSVGVEHFFIYSNDNNDRSDLLLKALDEEGIITFVENPVRPGMSAQTKAYGHGLNVLPDILDYEWCFILDGDEFITLALGYATVGDYLQNFSRWESDAIAINWKFVASEVNRNGLVDLTKPLTQRNYDIVSRGGIGEGWRLVKSAVRPGRAIQSRPHHPVWMRTESFTYRLTNGDIHGYRNPPPGIHNDPAFADEGHYSDIYISHYYYKSIIEWVWKYARNSGLDGAASFGVERYADYWANAFICQMNDPHEGPNENILIRAEGLLKELGRIRSIEKVAQAENVVRKTWQERLLALLDMVEEADVASRLKKDWRYVLDPLAEERKGSIPLHQI